MFHRFVNKSVFLCHCYDIDFCYVDFFYIAFMALKAKKKFANSSCLASTIKAGEDGSKKRRPRASNGQRYRVSIKKVCGERLDLEPRFFFN